MGNTTAIRETTAAVSAVFGDDDRASDSQVADVSEIRAHHKQLIEAASEARANYEFWQDVQNHPQFEQLRYQWEAEVQSFRERLEDAKGEDIKTLQADIRSRKAIMAQISELASTTSVTFTQEQLRRFEGENSLFLEEAGNHA